jgi:hypothetical protein
VLDSKECPLDKYRWSVNKDGLDPSLLVCRNGKLNGIEGRQKWKLLTPLDMPPLMNRVFWNKGVIADGHDFLSWYHTPISPSTAGPTASRRNSSPSMMGLVRSLFPGVCYSILSI